MSKGRRACKGDQAPPIHSAVVLPKKLDAEVVDLMEEERRRFSAADLAGLEFAGCEGAAGAVLERLGASLRFSSRCSTG